MRTIWIVRHGEPESPDGKHICLGQRSDPCLSKTGREQAEALSDFFRGEKITGVYCSTLKRSIETAEIISGGRWPVSSTECVSELDSGEWDGLPIEKIREIYPELYSLRKTDNSIPPPGGETYESGFARMCAAIATTRGNCIIVAHAGINRALLAKLIDVPYTQVFKVPQPYGCINALTEDGGKLTVQTLGVMPERVPANDKIARFYERCDTPEKVIRHCRATAALAVEIAEKLEEKGHRLNKEMLFAAASLHDIMRAKPNHAELGAEFLIQQGYPDPAGPVREHHELSQRHIDALDEYAVLYFADKLMQGERRVTLEERFSASVEICKTDEARSIHRQRLDTALKIRDKIKDMTGVEF